VGGPEFLMVFLVENFDEVAAAYQYYSLAGNEAWVLQ